MSWMIAISGWSESLLAGWSPGAGELKSREEGVAWMTGLRVMSASSVAILLASADTRLTSTGSRWREELLLSPLGPVNVDRV